MNLHRKAWQRDEGSIDMVQLVVGLMIIGIAAVGTFQALFYGYEQLDAQMRYRKAISMARSYVELWQGRIHTDFDVNNRSIRNGNLGRPAVYLLDIRDPMTDFDDVYCQLSYGPLEPVDLPTTGVGVDHWKIRVFCKWWEPNESYGHLPHEIFFDATMVPAAL